MAFDKTVWRQRFGQRLAGWRARMEQAGASSLYGFLAAMSLWPVVEAVQQGEWAALAALGSVAAGVGSNLLATMIQQWQDEADGARQLAQALPDNQPLRQEIEAVLKELDGVRAAQQVLPPAEQGWFANTLRQELGQWGGGGYTATVIGEGAVAQGAGSTAIGAKGVQVQGNVAGPIITGDYNTVVLPGPASIAGPPLSANRSASLRDTMAAAFNVEELQNLCVDMGVAYEDLAGEGRTGKVRELIGYCQRHGRVEQLLAACRAARPTVVWP